MSVANASCGEIRISLGNDHVVVPVPAVPDVQDAIQRVADAALACPPREASPLDSFVDAWVTGVDQRQMAADLQVVLVETARAAAADSAHQVRDLCQRKFATYGDCLLRKLEDANQLNGEIQAETDSVAVNSFVNGLIVGLTLMAGVLMGVLWFRGGL
jgi:hypothetical protein